MKTLVFFHNDSNGIHYIKVNRHRLHFITLCMIAGAKEYKECSAKTKDGVRDVFEAATRAALEKGSKNNKKCILL